KNLLKMLRQNLMHKSTLINPSHPAVVWNLLLGIIDAKLGWQLLNWFNGKNSLRFRAALSSKTRHTNSSCPGRVAAVGHPPQQSL
ncbi:MAG TPA: hypothetical protein VJL87_01090, partial [Bdellovibrionota bacterium]|nr:hypothetical protein [Bdellovibrionota bacterium]